MPIRAIKTREGGLKRTARYQERHKTIHAERGQRHRPAEQLGLGVFPVFNDYLIDSCQLLQFHINRILSRYLQCLPNIIGTNGQFSVTPVN